MLLSDHEKQIKFNSVWPTNMDDTKR